jgi:hypothetical protein
LNDLNSAAASSFTSSGSESMPKTTVGSKSEVDTSATNVETNHEVSTTNSNAETNISPEYVNELKLELQATKRRLAEADSNFERIRVSVLQDADGMR